MVESQRGGQRGRGSVSRGGRAARGTQGLAAAVGSLAFPLSVMESDGDILNRGDPHSLWSLC